MIIASGGDGDEFKIRVGLDVLFGDLYFIADGDGCAFEMLNDVFWCGFDVFLPVMFEIGALEWEIFGKGVFVEKNDFCH